MSEPKTLVRMNMPQELGGLRPAGTYTFDELYRLAQVCHASGMWEDTADAAQAMMKIMRGQEMGLPPTTAMAGFDIIKKRLFIKPWIIAAKINACGYGAYKVVAQTPQECILVFKRQVPGEGWLAYPPVTYTYAEAKAHGLTERSAHWKASPAHMLFQRCMGRGGAMYFPELLAGLQVSPDEAAVSVQQRDSNIVDLFGDDPRGSTPTPPRDVDPTTGEVLPPALREQIAIALSRDARLPTALREQFATPLSEDAPAQDPPKNQRDTPTVASNPPGPSPEPSRIPRAKTGHPGAEKDGFAWVTLRAHAQDVQLPKPLRDQIATALSVDEPATDAEADELASTVLTILDSLEE